MMTEDVKGLQAYGLILQECLNTMDKLQYLEPHGHGHEYNNSETSLQAQTEIESDCTSVSNDIVKFIEYQVKIICDPIFGNIKGTQGVVNTRNEINEIK